MPATAMLFLLGALAICGLPPLNGFISEFLIFLGLFKSLQTGGLFVDLTLLATIVSLALIGGLAVFCFTKAFSIVFLGTGRTNRVLEIQEVPNSMMVPKVLTGVLITAIGLAPFVFVEPLTKVTSLYTGEIFMMHETSATLTQVSIGALLFVGLGYLFWIIRARQQKKVNVDFGPTWSCGYSGANPAVHQYTATSYAQNYVDIVNPVVPVKREYSSVREDEIFALTQKFETHTRDTLEDYLIKRPVNRLVFWMERFAVFQTGKLQHYVLYALVFMVLVFLLTVLQYI